MISTAHISVENAPPIQEPFRFILTAPLFGALFSLVFLFYGPELISNRWNPELIGTLHLINIGVLMMITTGVLFQTLPVIGGIQFPMQRVASWLIYLALTAGGVLYFVGFLLLEPKLLMSAGVVLAAGIIPYLLLFAVGIFGIRRPPEIIYLIRYSLLFLLLLTGLGVTLLFGWGGAEFGVQRQWTDVHAVWGLGGWFTTLLMGTSFQMIPMFQVTPDFPQWIRKWAVPLVALSLLLWGGGVIFQLGQSWTTPLLVVAAVVMSIYAIITLTILSRRKRKLFDATVYLWRLAMTSLAAGSLSLIFSLLFMDTILGWLAILWIFGFLLPMISGTLMKIAPFLVFLHLQQRVIKAPNLGGDGSSPLDNLANIPNIFQIVPTKWSKVLLIFFLFSMVAWGATALLPSLVYLVGASLLLYFLWMTRIVFSCYRLYWIKLAEFGLENT